MALLWTMRRAPVATEPPPSISIPARNDKGTRQRNLDGALYSFFTHPTWRCVRKIKNKYTVVHWQVADAYQQHNLRSGSLKSTGLKGMVLCTTAA